MLLAAIDPNTSGLPGISALEKIVGALLTFGLIAAVAGIAISAIAWAIGSHSSNPHVAGRGKTGVLVSLAAAMLIGASNTLVSLLPERRLGGALMRVDGGAEDRRDVAGRGGRREYCARRMGRRDPPARGPRRAGSGPVPVRSAEPRPGGT